MRRMLWWATIRGNEAHLGKGKKKSRLVWTLVPYDNRMLRSELSRKGQAVSHRFSTQSMTERLDPLEAPTLQGFACRLAWGTSRLQEHGASTLPL